LKTKPIHTQPTDTAEFDGYWGEREREREDEEKEEEDALSSFRLAKKGEMKGA
jgi:hypothetical protein